MVWLPRGEPGHTTWWVSGNIPKGERVSESSLSEESSRSKGRWPRTPVLHLTRRFNHPGGFFKTQSF